MKDQRIIIKKVKKHKGEGSHGGQWKVAYADFVTAMMAFFLLLWLLSMSSPEKRVRLSSYFKNFSIFTESGTSFMDKSSEIFNDPGESAQKVNKELYGDNYSARLENMKNTLKQGIMEKLGDIKDQVIVDIVEGGVRIQMVDKDGSLMFKLGSSGLTPNAKKVLSVIAENIRHLSNKVIIEGHTDALTYARRDYSNWELSTERASSARKELEADGLDPEQISRVAGYAATDPIIKEDPTNPRNRRISIILLFPRGNKNITDDRR